MENIKDKLIGGVVGVGLAVGVMSGAPVSDADQYIKVDANTVKIESTIVKEKNVTVDTLLLRVHADLEFKAEAEKRLVEDREARDKALSTGALPSSKNTLPLNE